MSKDIETKQNGIENIKSINTNNISSHIEKVNNYIKEMKENKQDKDIPKNLDYLIQLDNKVQKKLENLENLKNLEASKKFKPKELRKFNLQAEELQKLKLEQLDKNFCKELKELSMLIRKYRLTKIFHQENRTSENSKFFIKILSILPYIKINGQETIYPLIDYLTAGGRIKFSFNLNFKDLEKITCIKNKTFLDNIKEKNEILNIFLTKKFEQILTGKAKKLHRFSTHGIYEKTGKENKNILYWFYYNIIAPHLDDFYQYGINLPDNKDFDFTQATSSGDYGQALLFGRKYKPAIYIGIESAGANGLKTNTNKFTKKSHSKIGGSSKRSAFGNNKSKHIYEGLSKYNALEVKINNVGILNKVFKKLEEISKEEDIVNKLFDTNTNNSESGRLNKMQEYRNPSSSGKKKYKNNFNRPSAK